jgi:hypothetical protein
VRDLIRALGDDYLIIKGVLIPLEIPSPEFPPVVKISPGDWCEAEGLNGPPPPFPEGVAGLGFAIGIVTEDLGGGLEN